MTKLMEDQRSQKETMGRKPTFEPPKGIESYRTRKTNKELPELRIWDFLV